MFKSRKIQHSIVPVIKYPSIGEYEDAINYFTIQQSRPTDRKKACCLCMIIGHFWYQCMQYCTLQTKQRRVCSLNLCLLCLGEDHLVSQC